MTITLDGTVGMTAPVGAIYNGLQTGTLVSASGTSVDFTGIPIWVKRITIMLYNVSTNGTSRYLVQVGSGSVATSGYLSNASGFGNSGGSTSGSQTSTAGHILMGWVATAANTYSGHVVITNITNNNYVISSILADTSAAPSTSVQMSAGYVSLSGLIDRVRITTVGGTDTFDAGSVNIMYE